MIYSEPFRQLQEGFYLIKFYHILSLSPEGDPCRLR